jgi:hypothetical protein
LLLLIIEALILSPPSTSILRLNLRSNFWANHLQETHEDAFKLALVHLFNVFKVRDHHLIRWNGRTPTHTHQSSHQRILHRGCCLTITSRSASSHIWNSGALMRRRLVSMVVRSIVVLLLILWKWYVIPLCLWPVLWLGTSGWRVVTGKLGFRLVYRLLLIPSRWHIINYIIFSNS